MILNKIRVNGIPVLIWGESSDKMIIAAHGSHSSKLDDCDIERAWFLSPITDMERIIHNLMDYCHITEEEFKKMVKVENDIEPLYYPYYQYICKHPITNWPHETYILRGETDTLSEYAFVKHFSDCFGCELTEQKGGEHWFHTESELDFFRLWIRDRLID